jgi:hypothetical protein
MAMNKLLLPVAADGLARVFVFFTAGILAGCTTTANIRVPENTQLYLEGRPVEVAADGTVTTRPYFWTSAPGIHYQLEKDGKVVQRGRLQSQFRPVSIFWPPYGLVYWPFGFKDDTKIDLINGTNAIVYPEDGRPAAAGGPDAAK